MKRSIYVLFVFLVGACSFDETRNPKRPSGSGTEDLTAGDNAFALLQKNLFAAKCEGCHGASRSAGGVNVSQFETVFSKRNQIVNAVSSRRMPPLGTVEDATIQLLKCWVEKGAGANVKTRDLQACIGQSAEVTAPPSVTLRAIIRPWTAKRAVP